jgi:hypothetical protein
MLTEHSQSTHNIIGAKLARTFLLSGNVFEHVVQAEFVNLNGSRTWIIYTHNNRYRDMHEVQTMTYKYFELRTRMNIIPVGIPYMNTTMT